MNDQIRQGLTQGQIIDITTTGRNSGEARRIEIMSHVIDGRIFISGMPTDRPRAWIHNLTADPRMIVHLKGAVTADVPATARVIMDDAERRRVFEWIATQAWRDQDVERMLTGSPLIEVTPELAAA